MTPPLPVMVAAYLGFGKPKTKPQTQNQDVEAFIQATMPFAGKQ